MCMCLSLSFDLFFNNTIHISNSAKRAITKPTKVYIACRNPAAGSKITRQRINESINLLITSNLDCFAILSELY